MIVVGLLSIIHVMVFLLAAYYWSMIKVVTRSKNAYLSFTILIPVRNEAAGIMDLLSDLEKQDYPKASFEVLILDDHSDDETVAMTEAYGRNSKLILTVLKLTDEQSGKKEALTMGVNHARFEHIITTDGDCRVGSGWIASYNRYYDYSNAVLVSGPVRMHGVTFFEKMQILEFGALIGFGAAGLKSGYPSMCNGANLSYQKSVFLEVDGYRGNTHIPSGDDEFLLQKVYASYPDRVVFLKDADAIVSTAAKSTISEFVNQRIRWSGKWRFHSNRFVKVLAIFVFLDYFSIVCSLLLALSGFLNADMVFLVLGFRYLAESALAIQVSRFLSIKSFLWPSLMLQIIYPICVSFLGFASIFGHYSWKGRNY